MKTAFALPRTETTAFLKTSVPFPESSVEGLALDAGDENQTLLAPTGATLRAFRAAALMSSAVALSMSASSLPIIDFERRLGTYAVTWTWNTKRRRISLAEAARIAVEGLERAERVRRAAVEEEARRLATLESWA